MSTTSAARAPARRRSAGPTGGPLGRLGSWSYRHRRLVAVAWLLVLAVASLAGRLAGSQFKNDLSGGTATQSQQAAAFLRQHFPGQAGDVTQVVFATRAPVTSAAVRQRIAAVLTPIARLPHVAAVRGPAAATGGISPDGHIAYALVRFDASGDAIPGPAVQRVITTAQRAARPGFAVQLGGAPVQSVEKPQFGKSEALGILAAVVILLLAFGSVIAMALPIVTAIVAVASSFGILDLLRWCLSRSRMPNDEATATTAARMPSASLLPNCGFSTLWTGAPPSCTANPGRAARCAVVITRWTAGPGMASPLASNRTRA